MRLNTSLLSPSLFLGSFCAIILLSLSPKLHAEQKSQRFNKAAEPRNLIEKSTILANGDYWTIVPKKSVLYVPEIFKSKIVDSPKGEFIAFQKFLARNGTWLYSYAIDLKYARGKKRLTQSHFNRLTQMNKVIVSTYQRGPITFHKNSYPLSKEETLNHSK